jgi:hypothetical protein
VCDPITGKQRRVAIPPELTSRFVNGAVLCAAGDLGHVHGGCHSSPFKLVLVSPYCQLLDGHPTAYVYSSKTGLWGNAIPTEASCKITCQPSVLVGNCLYWTTDNILEFNLDESSLTVIRGPVVTNKIRYGNRQIIQTDDGVVGFATLCYPHFHIWQKNVNDHGVATWVPWKIIELHNILKPPSQIEGCVRWGEIIHGYDEDAGVVFITVTGSLYMVQLKSMQSRKLYETSDADCYYAFKSFYVPGDSSSLVLIL